MLPILGNDACWSQMYRDQIRLLHDPVATELAYTDYHIVAQVCDESCDVMICHVM